MSGIHRARVLSACVAFLLMTGVARAADPGCVDVLLHCDPNSTVLSMVCGTTPQAVPAGASFVAFGVGVQSVTLTQCTTNATMDVTSDTNFCTDLPVGWNDQVCQIQIAAADTTSAPALTGVGLLVVAFLLFGIGSRALRYRHGLFPRSRI